MKVIFLEDVPNVAQAGELKEVNNGYGRNYHLPKKLAVLAKGEVAKMVELQQQVIAKRQKKVEAELTELAQQLETHEVTVTAKAGEKERIYGSVTSSDIAGELMNSLGITIDKKKIEIDEPIRQLGNYTVSIRLTKDLAPKLKVIVTGAKEPEKKSAPQEPDGTDHQVKEPSQDD